MGNTRAVYGIYKRSLKHLIVPESKKKKCSASQTEQERTETAPIGQSWKNLSNEVI